MATYFMDTTRRDICANVIGTGKRAYAGPQIASRSMNPPAPCETGTADPNSGTAGVWGGAGSDQSSL